MKITKQYSNKIFVQKEERFNVSAGRTYSYHCAVQVHMIECKDEEADKHDDDLWVVDRSGLGLDLIKRKHFSFTHSGKGGGRNKNLSTASFCTL